MTAVLAEHGDVLAVFIIDPAVIRAGDGALEVAVASDKRAPGADRCR